MARTSLALPASSLTAASLSFPNEMRYVDERHLVLKLSSSLQVAPLLKRQRRCRLQRPRQPQLQPPLPATPTAPPATPVATSCPTQGSITPSVSTSPPTKGPTTPPTTASITIMAPGMTTPLTDTHFYSYISHRSADYGSTNYVAAD
ncbi:hypothetical protein GN244_ATG09164 [Phytophthora infestans]|uniref:Uncharacterized protein n=1 Tax=Phytophthora infestans TaxID=4787 RepID=A0A833T8I1_PHYIN|nr:hypothetical protein GN244_ATG09164 [Phytophthora infestans]